MSNPSLKMTGRSLLTLSELGDDELRLLLDLADTLKARKKAGIRGDLLKGKLIALIFQKSSTRTRCAAVAAVADEGGTAEHLGSDIHLGQKESVADTARVLGRMFDGILFRGYKQATVETLARHAGVPVWNGLTDETHPTQAIADVMTLRECHGDLRGQRLVYIGNGQDNVANSLMAACAKVGTHYVNCTPPELMPDAKLVQAARVMAARNGSTVEVQHDPVAAVRGANAIYTDVWVSMGEEDRFQERVALLRPYQVTMQMMRNTGNLESGKVIFLHCLPAFHDNNTVVTRECGALEVTDEVFEAPFSKVFDQAENRVHTLKALMVATLT